MYSEAEKRVFGPYFDGQGERYADPLAIGRVLRVLIGPAPDQLLKDYHSDIPETALPAAQRFLTAVATAFEVLPFQPAGPQAGQGLVESELIALWNSYQEWCKKKVTSAASCPTSSPAMAGAGPQGGRTTAPTAGWSSIMAASAPAGLGTTPTAVPSPVARKTSPSLGLQP